MSFLPSALRHHSHEHDPEKGGSTSSPPSFPPPLLSRPTVLEPEAMNQLNTFRHMVGIHSTRGFLSQITEQEGGLFNSHTPNNTLHFDGRAAPNVGIYNRVCHREAQAKRGYKFAAMLINGCLGVQVIVAATLTAMGAANSNHHSITAFGAINTVIAGILTYLKGSGLPNRIRYYENEWKRVREYIEQRERDFSRADCHLDVNEIVKQIEQMYEQVKADIQANTPDNYISVSDMRVRSQAVIPSVPSAAAAGAGARSKLEDLELKYGHKVTDFLESLAHKEEERLKRIEGDIESSKSRALEALQEEARASRSTWESKLANAKVGAKDWVQDKADREAAQARDWERQMEEKSAQVAARELEHAKEGVLARGVSFARQLDEERKEAMRREEDLERDLERAKQAALQQGRDYEKDLKVKTARFAETEKDLEQEADRARIAAQRASESAQRAAEDVERVGESVGRVARTVDQEMHGQPQRKD